MDDETTNLAELIESIEENTPIRGMKLYLDVPIKLPEYTVIESCDIYIDKNGRFDLSERSAVLRCYIHFMSS